MPLHELRDWMAVAEAAEISERIKLQNDIANNARNLSKSGYSQVASERKTLLNRMKRLLMIGEGSEQEIEDNWGMLKSNGTSLMTLIRGGKS